MSKSKIVWKDWNPGKVKATITGRAEENVEKACQFVEEQARNNIRSRSGRLANAIGHVVYRDGDDVIGVVGMRRRFKAAFYGYFLEVGTRKMAAHPFLRPAVFNNARQIMKIITGK